MQENDIKELAAAGISAGGFGILGRAMAYVMERPRRPFGWALVFFELPVALGMGFLGFSIGAWLGLWTQMIFDGRFGVIGHEEQLGVAIVAGYLGPRVIDGALSALMARLGFTSKPKE